MIINLEDRLAKELDSIFDNRRTSQIEWDVCVEDIVEEFISRQRGYVEEDDLDDVLPRSGKSTTTTGTPFDAWTLLNNIKSRR